jgi:uncharacterized protein with GYD domain
MGHYITLIRYTQQGAAKIKESPARLDKARKPLRQQAERYTPGI